MNYMLLNQTKTFNSSSELGPKFQEMKKTGTTRTLEIVGFPNLTYLSLSRTFIYSIEGFNRIHLPKLTNLYLNENQIRTLSSARKATWKLNTINIKQNPIVDPGIFCQFQEQDLKWLSLESGTEVLSNNDIRWVCKLKSKQLSTLFIQSDSRIRQKSLTDGFSRKWKSINICGIQVN